MGDTSAPLRAWDVALACQRTIDEIIRTRWQTATRIVNSKVGTVLYEGKSPEEIAQLLPDEEALIVDLYRAQDSARLVKLIELARVVLEDGEDLRMQVSVEDFQIIKPWFRR